MGLRTVSARRAGAPFLALLLGAGAIKPAGLGARDTLRLEAGYALYGHELSRQRTPAGASQGRFMNFDKNFIGRLPCGGTGR